jgi:hypothetical protein
MDDEVDLIGGRAEGPERVLSNREGLVKAVRQGLVVGGVLRCGSVKVFCKEGEGAAVVDRRREG